MRTIVDPIEFWKGAELSDGGAVNVELRPKAAAAEKIWRMVLAMAMKDGAWWILYDVKHPTRFLFVIKWQAYPIVPPPDEMADEMVPAIDRLTRPQPVLARFLSRVRSIWASRVTRSFSVKHEGELVPWVASWPRRASDGPVMVFRETCPGPAPSVPRGREAATDTGPDGSSEIKE